MSARDARKQRLMKEFGKRLRASRIAIGYENAADLARDLDIDPNRYRHYERGTHLPPIDTLSDLREVLGKSLDFLIAGVSDLQKRP